MTLFWATRLRRLAVLQLYGADSLFRSEPCRQPVLFGPCRNSGGRHWSDSPAPAIRPSLNTPVVEYQYAVNTNCAVWSKCVNVGRLQADSPGSP